MQRVAMIVSIAMMFALQACAGETEEETEVGDDVSEDELKAGAGDAALKSHILKAAAVSADHYGDVHVGRHVRNEFGDAKLSASKQCKKIVGEYTFWRTQTAVNTSGFTDPLAKVYQCDATTGMIVFYEKSKQVGIRTITPARPWKSIFP